jgi:hypothetical protein
MRPTLVTAVFDLGRHTLKPQFFREANHYRMHCPAVLSIDLPMVVYCDPQNEAMVRELRGSKPTRIQLLTPEALSNNALYAPVQQPAVAGAGRVASGESASHAARL